MRIGRRKRGPIAVLSIIFGLMVVVPSLVALMINLMTLGKMLY
jgi:hypothetical protein